jgi:hypothetical protein
MAGRPTNAAQTKKNLAKARQIRLDRVQRQASPASTPFNTNTLEDGGADTESSGDIKCTGWNGGISHWLSSDEEPIIISDDNSEEEEVEELSESELGERGQGHLQSPGVTSPLNTEPNAHSAISCKHTQKDWKKAESSRSLGYNGQSARTKRRMEQLAREKEKKNAKLRNR